jgi:hypothetical protein
MLKPIILMYPVIPARNEEERAALRPIGRHRERYQDAIQGMTEIIQAADDMGLWGAATPGGWPRQRTFISVHSDM